MSQEDNKLTPDQIDQLLQGMEQQGGEQGGEHQADAGASNEAEAPEPAQDKPDPEASPAEGAASDPAASEEPSPKEQPGQAQPLKPGQIENPAPANGNLDLDFILDIPLSVTVEVGRTRMMIQELLQLGKGSVIELSKLLGEPFEVMVNDKLVARGEVVIVNDRFGIRLTDIISPNERVQSLASG